MHLHLFSFLISCRWHSPPAPTLTQSRSGRACNRNSLKCCGSWARCWQWSLSSSSSSPSCSLRSKNPESQPLPPLCWCRSVSGSSTFFGLHQEWKWDTVCSPSATWTQLLADQTVTASFPKIIHSETGSRLICPPQTILYPPPPPQMILARLAIFNCVPCEVSVGMAADSAPLTKSAAWLSRSLC